MESDFESIGADLIGSRRFLLESRGFPVAAAWCRLYPAFQSLLPTLFESIATEHSSLVCGMTDCAQGIFSKATFEQLPAIRMTFAGQRQCQRMQVLDHQHIGMHVAAALDAGRLPVFQMEYLVDVGAARLAPVVAADNHRLCSTGQVESLRTRHWRTPRWRSGRDACPAAKSLEPDLNDSLKDPH